MIRLVFLTVVFGGLTRAESAVEQPTNVTLHCRNLQNVLTWDYGEVTDGLKFKVNIGSVMSSGFPKIWVNPPALQADLSFLSDPDDIYFITVSAVVGNDTSDPVPTDGLIFSYFHGALLSQICFLDLPWVNVTAKENNSVIFRFENPWLFHKRNSNTKSRKKKSHESPMSKAPMFMYNIVVDNQAQHSHDCQESVCEHSLRLDITKRHCLNITGETKKVLVKSTQQYCVQPLAEAHESNNNYIAFTVIGILVTCVVVFVVFLIYQKKTSPSSSLPQSVVITDQKKWPKLNFEQEKFFVPEIDVRSPTHLLPSTEETDPMTTAVPATEPDIRGRIGNLPEDGVCDDMDEGNDDGPYRPGRYLDEEAGYSREPSGYERREELVSLGPGDQAEGYRG